MIRGLIFDFDGLILETEGPIYQSWQEIYHSYGCHLPFDSWTNIIGTSDYEFEPITELERQYGAQLDRQALQARHRQLESEMIVTRPAMPGVQGYLNDAEGLGLKIGLASSSTCEWVTGHLDRLGLTHHFDCIKGSDDVHRTKPDPQLFLAVLDELELGADEAIVLEDSPNGVLAAKSAGIYCVAVPNGMTRGLKFDHADMRLESLEELPLEKLLRLVN